MIVALATGDTSCTDINFPTFFHFRLRPREQTFSGVGQCSIVDIHIRRPLAFDTEILGIERTVERTEREVYIVGLAFDCHS